MTRLTYIFPCAAGCLRVAIPLIARYIESTDSRSQLWLATLISAGSLGVCCVYLITQGLISIFVPLKVSHNEFKSFFQLLYSDPKLCIAFLNGAAAAAEIFLLINTAAKLPYNAFALLFISFSQAQLLLGVIGDTFGCCWIPNRTLSVQTLSGGAILLLGSVIIETYPISSGYSYEVAGRILLCMLAGSLSFINYAFTRQLSICCASYWTGTCIFCAGQFIFLMIISFIKDPHQNYNRNVLEKCRDEALQTNMILLLVASIASQIIGSACVQLFGSTGGFYTVLGAAAAGQIVLTVILEISYSYALHKEDISISYILYPTGYIIMGLGFVIIGSILMWIGRWDSLTDRKKRSNSTPRRSTPILSIRKDEHCCEKTEVPFKTREEVISAEISPLSLPSNSEVSVTTPILKEEMMVGSPVQAIKHFPSTYENPSFHNEGKRASTL